MDLILKGFIIGIGKIIPGVSGSMLAITLGIYEQIIEKIANIKKEFKKATQYLLKPAIGIILAIITTSKIIVKCLNKYYFPTMLLFVGLIAGGIPKQIKQIKLKKTDLIISILITLIILIITKDINIKNNHQIEYTIIEFIKIIGIGILDAASSIIPGISGTALLMMIGYYNIILETFSSINNPKNIIHNIFVLIPFSIGFIIGIIIISKIINKIIKRKKNTMNTTIITFMTLTTIIILKQTLSTPTTIIQKIIGITLFILGFTITNKPKNKE